MTKNFRLLNMWLITTNSLEIFHLTTLTSYLCTYLHTYIWTVLINDLVFQNFQDICPTQTWVLKLKINSKWRKQVGSGGNCDFRNWKHFHQLFETMTKFCTFDLICTLLGGGHWMKSKHLAVVVTDFKPRQSQNDAFAVNGMLRTYNKTFFLKATTLHITCI
jgi:hypothetical protein